jgi:hypothetical protein
MCQLVSLRGTPSAERRSQQLLAQIEALSEKLGTPAARAVLCITQAVSFWMRRRPADVLAPSYEAERLCREQPLGHVGDYHMRFSVVTVRIGALYQLGDYAAFAAELRAALQEAHATDNHAALLTLALNETLLDEIQNRADEAVARLTQQRLALPQSGFSLYHALHMIAVCCAATASGQHAWGRRVLDEYWPRFLRSPVRRAATISLAAARWRIGLLLNEHSDEDCAEPYSLARIRTERKASLRRIGHGSEPYTVMTDARLAYLQGDKGKAIRLLRHVVAVPGFDVQLTRYALGHLLEGEEGAALCADSLQQMLAVGVVNPLKMVRTTFPEMFRERRGQR